MINEGREMSSYDKWPKSRMKHKQQKINRVMNDYDWLAFTSSATSINLLTMQGRAMAVPRRYLSS